jgi:hypothetical protein
MDHFGTECLSILFSLQTPSKNDDEAAGELLDFWAQYWVTTNPFGRLADWLQELLDEGRQA